MNFTGILTPNQMIELEFQLNQRTMRINNEMKSLSLIEIDDIAQDPDFKYNPKPRAANEPMLSVNEIYRKDEELAESLKYLNKLWLINGLLIEIESCMLYGDVEQLLYVVNKCQVSIDEFESFFSYAQVDIIGEIESEHARLKVKAIQRIEDVFNELLIFGNDAIQRYAYKEINESDVEFNNVYQIIQSVPQLKDKYNLSRMFQKDDFYGKNNLEYKQKEGLFTLSKGKEIDTFQDFLKSSVAYISFVAKFFSCDASFKNYMTNKITTILNEEIGKNLDKIYQDGNLSELLQQIIDTGKKFHLNLKVDNINDLFIQFKVDYYVDLIRNVYLNQDNFSIGEYVSNVPIVQQPTATKRTTHQADSNTVNVPIEDDDDNWNEWGDEIDLDIDEIDGKADTPKDGRSPKRTKTDSKAEDGEFDEWAEWNDEIHIDDDLVNEPHGGQVDTSEKETDDQYQISKIPKQVVQLIENFQHESVKLPVEYRDEYLSKIESIETTIMIMSFKYDDFFNAFNDLSYISQKFNLSRMKEYNIKSFEKYMISLKEGIDSSGRVELIINWFNEFTQNAHKSQNKNLYKVILIELVNSLNHKIIEQIIYKPHEIDIVQINDKTNKLMKYENIIQQSEGIKINLNKLQNLLKFLNCDLDEILNYFYNGDFFEFSTEEIIKLIRAYNNENSEHIIREIMDIRNTE